MKSRTALIFAGLVIAAVVAVSSAWLASGDPDGVERVAEDKEFIETAKDPGYEILPGYTIPGIDGEVSTALAGIAIQRELTDHQDRRIQFGGRQI